MILLYFLFAYGISIALGLVLQAAGASPGRGAFMTMDVAGYTFAAAIAVVEALVALVNTAGLAALYFELRRVKDGVGVEQLAKVFE